MAIWAIGMFVQPILDKFHSPLDIRYFTGYAGYLVLGYYLKTYGHPIFERVRIGWFLYLAGTAVTFVGTLILSERMGRFSGFFYDYLMPNVALQAVGAFLILKNTAFQSPLLQKVDTDGYGIYLSHVLVLQLLSPFFVHVVQPTLFIPTMTALCLFFSWALVRLLKLSLPLQKFVG